MHKLVHKNQHWKEWKGKKNYEQMKLGRSYNLPIWKGNHIDFIYPKMSIQFNLKS